MNSWTHVYVYLFVDTREHSDVSLSSEPFNSWHIPGLNKVRREKFLVLRLFMPPWKWGHSVLQLSVDQVLSSQYHLTPSLDQYQTKPLFSAHCVVCSISLTPSLDQYQTWCRGYPQWVDDPYLFSGHMFKGQGTKVKVKPLFRVQCVVRSISFDSLT